VADPRLPFLSVGELTALFKSGEVSPVEAVDACLGRIEDHNQRINAFTLIDADGARRAAAESERRWQRGEPRGPLEGVPFTVKDNLMVAGYPFRRGSLVAPETPAKEDAPIVARCRESGAIVIGLTTMPEFGVGPVTISPLTGITRNPWDTSKQSGGSSGGAAAGLAAGFCNFALGSDAGGSIRIPAALTGVVGLKPTAGRIPMYPPSAAGTLSCNGPLTRTVGDAALLLNHVVRSDPRDGLAPYADVNVFPVQGPASLSNMRIAASPTLGYAPLVHPDVDAAFRQAVDVFIALGVDVSFEDPPIEDPIAPYLTLLRAGYQYSLRTIAKDEANRQKLSPPIKDILFETPPVALVEYLQAVEQCQVCARRFHEFHARYDLLLTPTVACPAFAAERLYPEAYEPFPNRRAWTPFTALFNLTGQPAISVPIRLSRDGLPIGLQIVAPRGGESAILTAAAAFADANGFRERPPL
jgi:aspartyl-tRNA(Asn)/glutamyl-tRNA(Gln) amidotransferase subunit A